LVAVARRSPIRWANAVRNDCLNERVVDRPWASRRDPACIIAAVASTSSEALRRHVEHVHHWLVWLDRMWEGIVDSHADQHERFPERYRHDHADMPDVTW
jgi:hypothetical protein